MILIYEPHVQQWAVEKATEWLSENTDYDVSVEKVRLKFPLDLSVGGVTAISKGDTLMTAGELIANVKLMPLFDGELESDEVSLRSVCVNTHDLIDQVVIDGCIEQLSLNTHTTDLNNHIALLSTIEMNDADLNITIPDSVPEDTTESEPIEWKIIAPSLRLNRVALNLHLPPSSENTSISAFIGSAETAANIDLQNNTYALSHLLLKESSAAYDTGENEHAPYGFDANHINLDSISTEIDSLFYGGNLYADISHLKAYEVGGLSITDLNGVFTMDSTSIAAESFNLLTEDTRLRFDAKMSDDYYINAQGAIGKQDIIYFAADYAHTIAKWMPAFPLNIDIEARGTEEDITINRLKAFIGTLYKIDFSGSIFEKFSKLHIGSLALKAPGIDNLTMNGNIANLTDGVDAITANARLSMTASPYVVANKYGFQLPQTDFVIPKSVRYDGVLGKNGSRLTGEGTLRADAAILQLRAMFDTKTEEYDVAANASRLNVNDYYKGLSEQFIMAGAISAKGRGFDFNSPHTTVTATADMEELVMGDMNLSNTHATLAYSDNHIAADLQSNNKLVRTNMSVNGLLTEKEADLHIKMDLPHSNLHALGLYDKQLQVGTSGTFDIATNYRERFDVKADVNRLHLIINNDTIDTNPFVLNAFSDSHKSSAQLYSGDMELDIRSASSIDRILPRLTAVSKEISTQASMMKLDINNISRLLPEATVYARMGHDNPIYTVLSTFGIKYNDVMADFTLSPSTGITGTAYATNLHTETIDMDSAFIELNQTEDNRLAFSSRVKGVSNEKYKSISARAEGYLKDNLADVDLFMKNGLGETMFDLGLQAMLQDTALRVHIKSEEPTLMQNRFRINTNNYLELKKRNQVFADIEMKSLSEHNKNCVFELHAEPQNDEKQHINLVVKSFELARILDFFPNLPQFAGLLDADAAFIQSNDGSYKVEGGAGINNFMYDNMQLGDLSTTFTYAPVGETGHGILCDLYNNDTKLAVIEGNYDTEGNGNLQLNAKMDKLPLTIVSPFISTDDFGFNGNINGDITVNGSLDELHINGKINPDNVHIYSDPYSFNMRMDDAPIIINESRISFTGTRFYSEKEQQPLTLTGDIDFANFNNLKIELNLAAKDYLFINAKRKQNSLLYGKMYGDLNLMIRGQKNDINLYGTAKVLRKTNMTYILQDSPISQGYRLSDIVTFTDFTLPPDTIETEREKSSIMGLGMSMQIEVEDGSQLHCILSADGSSYVDVRSNGKLMLTNTAQGTTTLQGRLTISSGEMKYSLPVIPLKTFNIQNGSYVDFKGDPLNPTINLMAAERTRAVVTDDANGTRNVTFDVGIAITQTLSDMGLEFTIDALDDLTVQNELKNMSATEKNKLAVGLLASGMYLSTNNSSGLAANNALNTFLQSEINNIVGKALKTVNVVDISLGMETTDLMSGQGTTDYSFQFSKRLFSDRLNVIVGGKVSTGNEKNMQRNNEAYIDDVSVEWRIDNKGTRYVRLFYGKDYNNLLEGELTETGAGFIYKKKLDNISDLFRTNKKKKK